MNSDIVFTDRYQALGLPYPDPETMCQGQCEGTGLVPIHNDELNEPWRSLWLEAHKNCDRGWWWRLKRFVRDFRKVRRWGLRTHWRVCFTACDGWHFVVCPDCNGTRVRKERLPR